MCCGITCSQHVPEEMGAFKEQVRLIETQGTRAGLKCLNCCGLGLPLLIIAGVGMFAFPSALGMCAVGISGTMALSNCASIGSTCLNQNKVVPLDPAEAKKAYIEDIKDLIGSVVIAALGVLTITGVLPPMALGLCIIAKSVLSAMLNCCIQQVYTKKLTPAEQQAAEQAAEEALLKIGQAIADM